MSHSDFYYHFHLLKARHHHPCITDETNHKVALVAFWEKKIPAFEVLILCAIKRRATDVHHLYALHTHIS